MNGIITRVGSLRFETARRRLAALAKWEPGDVSDADVVEYLARGHTNTRTYLRDPERANRDVSAGQE